MATITADEIPEMIDSPDFAGLPDEQRVSLAEQALDEASAGMAGQWDRDTWQQWGQFSNMVRERAGQTSLGEKAGNVLGTVGGVLADSARTAGVLAVGLSPVVPTGQGATGLEMQVPGETLVPMLGANLARLDQAAAGYMAGGKEPVEQALNTLRTQIDTGDIPFDPEGFGTWLDGHNAALEKAQRDYYTMRQGYAQEGVPEEVKAQRLAAVDPWLARNSLARPENIQALNRYLRTRSPAAFDQLRSNLLTSPEEGQIDAARNQLSTQSTLGRALKPELQSYIQEAADPAELAGTAFGVIKGADAVAEGLSLGKRALELGKGVAGEVLGEQVSLTMDDPNASPAQRWQVAKDSAIGALGLAAAGAAVKKVFGGTEQAKPEGGQPNPMARTQPVRPAPVAVDDPAASEADFDAIDAAAMSAPPTTAPTPVEAAPVAVLQSDIQNGPPADSVAQNDIQNPGAAPAPARLPVAPAFTEDAQSGLADLGQPEGNLLGQLQMARVGERVNLQTGARPLIPDNPMGRLDLLDFLNQNPVQAKARTGSTGGEYDWQERSGIPKYYRPFISAPEGLPIDVVAQMAHERSLIPEPTPDALMAQAGKDIAERQTYKVQARQRDQALADEERRVVNWDKSQAKLAQKPQGQQIPLNDLNRGDALTIDGEAVTVADVQYDEDGYAQRVTLEDGKKFGVLSFNASEGQGVFVEAWEPGAAAADVSFLEDDASTTVPEAPAGLVAGSKAEQWADRTLAQSRGRQFTGLDPVLATAYAVKGAAIFERGVRDAATWTAEMLKEFGNAVRPYLDDVWQQVSSGRWRDGMKPTSTPRGKVASQAVPLDAARFATVQQPMFYTPGTIKGWDAQAANWLNGRTLEQAAADLAGRDLAGMTPDQQALYAAITAEGLLRAEAQYKLAKTDLEILRTTALMDKFANLRSANATAAAQTLAYHSLTHGRLTGLQPLLSVRETIQKTQAAVVDAAVPAETRAAVEEAADVATDDATLNIPAMLDEAVPAEDVEAEARVREMEARIAQLQQQLTSERNALSTTSSTWQRIMDLFRNSGGRKSAMLSNVKDTLKQKRERILAANRARRQSGQVSSLPLIDPAERALIGALYIAEGIVEFTNWSQAMVREIGATTHAELLKLYDQASKMYLAELENEDRNTKKNPPKARTPKERVMRAESEANKAARVADGILDNIARTHSDPPIWTPKKAKHPVRVLYDEHVANPMPQAEFAAKLQELKVPAQLASTLAEAAKLEIAAREEITRVELANQLRAELDALLKDSPALAKMMAQLRPLITGKMSWHEVFTSRASQQKQWELDTYAAIRQHPVLYSLEPAEARLLTRELSKAWQRERRKIFKAELEKTLRKVGDLKPKVKAKVEKALPRLLELINLGALDADTFRDAMAREFGLKQLNSAEAVKARDLATKLQEAPEGLPRRIIAQEFYKQLQSLSLLTGAEILESYWTTAVLSGPRTITDIALGVANSIEDVGATAVVTATRTGRPDLVARAMGAMLKQAPQALHEAWLHLRTGDRSMMKAFDAELNSFMEDGKKMPDQVARALISRGGWQKMPGYFMQVYGRILMGLDHITQSIAAAGSKHLAMARHPELYKAAMKITDADRRAVRMRARQVLTQGAEPANHAERVRETAYTKELLDKAIPTEILAEAQTFGELAALQGEPTGVAAGILATIRFISTQLRTGSASMDKMLEGQNSAVANIVRPLAHALRIASTTERVIMGTKFVRSMLHATNRGISYIPVVGLGRLAEKNIFQAGIEQDKLIAKQIMGTAAALGLYLAYAAMVDDDDEGIEGNWAGLTPAKRAQLMAEGKQPLTVWYRQKDGRVRSFNYNQWGIGRMLAIVGAMMDRQKYLDGTGDSVIGELIAGITQGMLAVKDMSQVSAIGALLGDSPYSSADPATSFASKLNKYAATLAGGLIPRVAKDIDLWIDPGLRDSRLWWQKWAAQVPMLREMSSGVRVDILGKPIELQRGPTSRLSQLGPVDEGYRILGRLNHRGLWLPDPSSSLRTVKMTDGTRREPTAQERDRYQRKAGELYRDWLLDHGEELLKMDPEAAKKQISKATKTLRTQAFNFALGR